MYKLIDGKVIYKSSEMIDWILWGLEVIVSQVDDTKFVLKKFNLEKEEYELYKVSMPYEYEGQEVEVVDGVFYYEIPDEPEEVVDFDETQLAQLEVLATIYEEILEIKDSISS